MINWDRVTELRDEIGPEDFAEVVEIFLEEVEQVTSRLETAPSMESLGADLHFLKGGALNLGFNAFSTLCQAGETSCAEGAPESVDIARILQAYAESKAEFQAQLNA